jgi:replicative DNA helicase
MAEQDFGTILKDYSLPININNESLILSNTLNDEINREIFSRRVKYSDFRKKEYQTVAWAIHSIIQNKLEVNVDSVLLHQSKSPVRQPIDFEFITALIKNFPVITKENFDDCVNRLIEDNVKDEIITTAFKSLVKDCIDPKVGIDKLTKDVTKLNQIVNRGTSASTREFESLEELVDVYDKKKEMRPDKRTCGFPVIDAKLTEGLKDGGITTICGLPGSGKSSFALTLMYNLANQLVPSAQFALEMDAMSLMHKLVAIDSQLPVSLIVQRKERYDEWQKAKYEDSLRMLRPKLIYINEKPSQSLASAREQAMILQDHLKTQYIVTILDLFGKISDFQGSDNFARDYEKKCNDIQRIAKELGNHWILVSQINREATKRKHQRATLADLKNSSALVEISDLIFSVNRPFYNSEVALKSKFTMGDGPMVVKDEIEEDQDKDLAEVILLKQRMGLGNELFNFKFHPETTRFIEINEEGQEYLKLHRSFDED